MSDPMSPQPQPTPPHGQPPAYAPPPKKSNLLRNVIIGVVVLMVLMCGGCFAIVGLGANEVSKEVDKSVQAEESDSTPTEDSEATPAESAKPEKTEEEEEAEPSATWKTVAKLAGNTNKAGPDFRLSGCDTRMTYTVQGGDMLIVAFYVMESGTSLTEDGGIPVASPTESGRGETVIRLSEGDYYLETASANATWSVQVQEKC